jgi:hypothetical protein
MSNNIISFYDINQTDSVESGKKLYKYNENYKYIANFMENPDFRQFYNNNFSNWIDVKNIVMFFKIYEEIENRSTVPLNSYQKLDILDKIIKNGEMRKKVCQEITDWSKGENNIKKYKSIL